MLVERPTRVKGIAIKDDYIGPCKKITKKIDDLSSLGFPSGRPNHPIVHPCHQKKYIPRLEPVNDDCIDPNFIPRETIDYQEELSQVHVDLHPEINCDDADIDHPPYSLLSRLRDQTQDQ